MGQYYRPINLDKMEYLHSHEYGDGLKLMEHSWIGNNFVATIESLIKRGGLWFGNRIVWAGDYADDEPNTDDTLFSLVKNRIKPEEQMRKKRYRFLVNLDKKEYVNMSKVSKCGAEWMRGEVWKIHPLPLLTCEGNGRGGGDYRGDKYGNGSESKLIGSWARCRVIIQTKKPSNKDFKEIIFDLVE